MNAITKHLYPKYWIIALLVLVAGRLWAVAPVVNSFANEGAGTLRAAILAVNASGDADNDILFDLPGQAPFVLQPTTPLPAVLNSVNILGGSQAGFAGLPVVAIASDDTCLTADGNAILQIFDLEFRSVSGQPSGLGLSIQNVLLRAFIARCTFRNKVTGIWARLSSDPHITGNRFINTGIGQRAPEEENACIYLEGISQIDSGLIIHDNSYAGTFDHGIYLESIKFPVTITSDKNLLRSYIKLRNETGLDTARGIMLKLANCVGFVVDSLRLGSKASAQKGTCIEIQDCARLDVFRSTFQHRRKGISVIRTFRNLDISCNTILGNRIGLSADVSAVGNLENNIFVANDTGMSTIASEQQAGNNYWGGKNGPANLGGLGDTLVGNVVATGFLACPAGCTGKEATGFAVLGNGQSISNGQNNPSTTDSTWLDTVPNGRSRRYRYQIINQGHVALRILPSRSRFVGANAEHFALEATAPISVDLGDTASLFLRFSGLQSEGEKTATLVLLTNDCQVDTFRIGIGGFAKCIGPERPVAISDTNVCLGAPIALKVLGGELNSAVEWVWYRGTCGEQRIGTGDSIVVDAREDARYFVRGEGTCNDPGLCDSVQISIKPADTLAVFTNAPVCIGQALIMQLDSLSTSTVTWDGPNGFASTERVLRIDSATMANAGLYTINSVSTSGCINSKSINIEVVDGQFIETRFLTAATACQGDTLNFVDVTEQLPQNTLSTWLWDFGDGQSSTERYPTHIYADSGRYTLQVSIQNGACVSASMQKEVYISGCAPKRNTQGIAGTHLTRFEHFPNPIRIGAEVQLEIEALRQDAFSITVLNPLGQVHQQFELGGDKQYRLRFSLINSGLYWLRVQAPGGVFSQSLLVVP